MALPRYSLRRREALIFQMSVTQEFLIKLMDWSEIWYSPTPDHLQITSARRDPLFSCPRRRSRADAPQVRHLMLFMTRREHTRGRWWRGRGWWCESEEDSLLEWSTMVVNDISICVVVVVVCGVRWRWCLCPVMKMCAMFGLWWRGCLRCVDEDDVYGDWSGSGAGKKTCVKILLRNIT